MQGEEDAPRRGRLFWSGSNSGRNAAHTYSGIAQGRNCMASIARKSALPVKRTKFDVETDIVVIGGGAGGRLGAVRALEGQ